MHCKDRLLVASVALNLVLLLRSTFRYSPLLATTTRYYAMEIPVIPPPEDEASLKPSEFTSAFERIHNLTYSLASTEKDSSQRISPETFDLAAWTKLGHGGGGLSDWDRKKLVELYSKVRSVFEYGLGESTKLAAHVSVPRYSGIDSDSNWVATARDGSPDHFRFSFADVGNLRGWGTADNPNANKNYLNYQVAPLVVEKKAFDVYMVDGRWRAACALVSMLHASARGNPNALILIHDFVDKERSIHCAEPANCNVQKIRASYHRVKQVADLVDHSGNKLAVFRRKENVTDDDIFHLWEKMMTVDG